MSAQVTQRKGRAATSSLSSSSASADSSSSAASSLSSLSASSLVDRLRRLLDREQEWDKGELLDAIYWLRQVLAVLLGPLFGLLGLTGSVGLVLFVAVLLVGVFGWYGKYQQVDVEEMGSWQLMSEGSWPAFALFIVNHLRTHPQCTQSQVVVM